MAKRARKSVDDLLPFPAQHGGRRAGAGRKPNGEHAGVRHAPRAALASRFPVHVTLKVGSALPRLRQARERRTLLACFAAVAARTATGFRLCHYTILNDHIHLVAEAPGRDALQRGMQGLAIRLAKALNKLWGRRGRVFADRYHDRILKTPREVRNVLVYVLGNARKHAAEGRMVAVPQPIDTFSSAPWFDGFREQLTTRGLGDVPLPVAPARTWLLTTGWRRHGLLSVYELPATGGAKA